jgi:transcriptional regulator with XRE-family HTH domain
MKTITDKEKMAARLAMGEKIKARRNQLGIGQLTLSRLAGVTPANVVNVEKGRYSVGLDVLNRIAEALGTKIDLVEK